MSRPRPRTNKFLATKNHDADEPYIYWPGLNTSGRQWRGVNIKVPAVRTWWDCYDPRGQVAPATARHDASSSRTAGQRALHTPRLGDARRRSPRTPASRDCNIEPKCDEAMSSTVKIPRIVVSAPSPVMEVGTWALGQKMEGDLVI